MPLPGPWPRRPSWCLCAVVALGGLSGLGCPESRQESERRAEARRQAAARRPLPVRIAGTALNRVFVARLDDALARGTPPFLVEREILSGEGALARLAADRLDVVLMTGAPDPRLAASLAQARKHARVLVLGADVIAVLANVTNRSSRIDLDGLGRALRGQATTWTELKGDALPLVPYTLPAEADLSRLLRTQLLADAPLAAVVRQVEDVETQLESARRTPGALALVALGRLGPAQALPDTVKPLPVASQTGSLGLLPTDRAAASRGDYPLRLPVVALVRRGDDPVARRLRERGWGARPVEREAWLGLPGLPASDRERIRRLWAAEGPTGAQGD